MNSLSKSMSYSHSPAIRQKQIIPISKLNQHPNDHTSLILPESRLSDTLPKEKLKQTHSPLNKIVKIASNQKINNKSMHILNDYSSNSSMLEVERSFGSAKKVNIENILLERLKNEKNIEKKFDIVISTAEKLVNVDRNFSIFYKVVKRFLIEYKENLINKSDSLDKYEEIKENYTELKSSYDKLFEEFKGLRRENDILKAELEKIREENYSMKNKIKRNAAFLNKLKEKGIPVEKLYKDIYGNGIKSKSLNKINLDDPDKKTENEEIAVLKPEKKIKNIPKLNIDATNNEGYQDEFMSKFNEFSESWRKQIIKDHHLIND